MKAKLGKDLPIYGMDDRIRAIDHVVKDNAELILGSLKVCLFLLRDIFIFDFFKNFFKFPL